MKLFIILGNQLFPINYLKNSVKDHKFFMAEDYELCSNFNHNKNKLLFFLSSMRSYSDYLKKHNVELLYFKIEDDTFKKKYTEKLKLIINKYNIKEVSFFEIEDKGFESELKSYLKNSKIHYNVIQSPMFLNSRESFKEFLSQNKKPLMANYYKMSRKKFKILIDDKNNPVGGKWSFDQENRKKLPKNITIPKRPTLNVTHHTQNLKLIIEREFPNHIGDTKNFWFATTQEDVNKLLYFFIEKKFQLFGDYEDSVDQRDNILFHSALSPYINIGLITPEIIIKKIKNLEGKIPLNSLEGYIRQLLGWREFIRGIYQNFDDKMLNSNFFNHKIKMKESWYNGTTGLPPLDYAIKNASKNAWSHHIERLMILSNLMNLCEIEPKSVFKWFMEMYADSSEWVMYPNVFGMGLYSDGGIFSTKPYICGSSYILKMMDFQKGDWCNIMDGLYWRFISKNRSFFLKNPRSSMMVSLLDKMNEDRKKSIISSAEQFISENTFI